MPRSAAALLTAAGIDTVHVGDLGLSTAEDAAILQAGLEADRTVVTLDADFHALLAMSGAIAPSVIRIRIEGLRGEALTELLLAVSTYLESPEFPFDGGSDGGFLCSRCWRPWSWLS